jgi:hypothetical protein
MWNPQRYPETAQRPQGTGGSPHAPDEWVEVRSLLVTAAIFAGMIRDYLNLPEGEKNVPS